MTIEMPKILTDGNYQLIIDADCKYFRDPRAYLFDVANGEIINKTHLEMMTFTLSSPRDYTAETVIALSWEPKDGKG